MYDVLMCGRLKAWLQLEPSKPLEMAISFLRALEGLISVFKVAEYVYPPPHHKIDCGGSQEVTGVCLIECSPHDDLCHFFMSTNFLHSHRLENPSTN